VAEGSAIRACARAAIAVAVLWLTATPVLAQTPDEHPQMETPPPSSLMVRAFGAVQWLGTQKKDSPNTFTLGQLALFATSDLGERVSVLAEIVLEGNSASTEVVTDVERLQLTFRFNDALNLSAGRYHTGIGFYNAAFHHGAYFETPIGRPRVFAFEDEGGVLPVHEVGLSMRGIVPKTGSSLRYLAEVGNGRNWDATSGDADAVNTPADQNGAKSTNLGLAFRPGRVAGLEVGGSFYRDSVPRSGTAPVAQRIGVAYAVYRTPAIELMGEWLRLQHRPPGAPTITNNAGYLQASRAWGTWRPYYRYDRLAIDPATPFIGFAGSYRANIVGVRVDPVQWVGLKGQYEHTDEPQQRGIKSFRAQLVFVF
jgi:hypothetical protein